MNVLDDKSYFHDPIHGHIALTSLEKGLVDTVEFQRLRFIRQLSLMHYVFPGSFHTRFAHSLGVCHNASRVAKQLFRGEENQLNYCVQIFRLASLLHDIGHGAFSHSLTHIPVEGGYFLPRLSEVCEKPDAWGLDLISSRELFQDLIQKFHSKLSKPIAHEVISVLIIHRLFQQIAASDSGLLQGVEVEDWQTDVSAMLLNANVVSRTFEEGAEELLQGGVEILDVDSSFNSAHFGKDLMRTLSYLVAGTIDTDRMDYLLRDSQNCGVSYGLFDSEGLVSSLRLVNNESRVHIAIEAKRANTLDDFLWSRYQMFRQIYCHKTHNAYNLLLQEAFLDLVRLGELTVPSSLNDYLTLTDDRVMSKVFWLAQTVSSDAPWVEAFARRRLPQFLGVFEASVDDPVWERPVSEIFLKLGTGEYDGWESDERFCYTSLKTEVLKVHGSEGHGVLPWLIDTDKVTGKLVKKSLLSKSVFFNSDLVESKRLEELQRRLNRRLMFFYRHRVY